LAGLSWLGTLVPGMHTQRPTPVSVDSTSLSTRSSLVSMPFAFSASSTSSASASSASAHLELPWVSLGSVLSRLQPSRASGAFFWSTIYLSISQPCFIAAKPPRVAGISQLIIVIWTPSHKGPPHLMDPLAQGTPSPHGPPRTRDPLTVHRTLALRPGLVRECDAR
jgi:hypothetical protein